MRWSAVGSLAFPIAVALHHDVTLALVAAAVAIAVAPVATGRRIVRAAPRAAGTGIGRVPVSVLVWSLAYNSAFVVFLGIATHSLGHRSADRVALALTFVQAALVIPMQYAQMSQPRLVEEASDDSNHEFAATQAALVLALALAAYALAGVVAAVGSFEWDVFGLMAAAIVPLGLGLTGGYALQLSEGGGVRFVVPPVAMVALLGVAQAIPGATTGRAGLVVCWTAAATAGALAHPVNRSWTYLRRPLGIALLASFLCAAAGFVHPALAALAACGVLVAMRGRIARGLLDARAHVALQR
jgi:hypothetical protein